MNQGKHPVSIDFSKYANLSEEESMKVLARDLASLRYDALEEFLSMLSNELIEDSYQDRVRRRPILSRNLLHSALRIEGAAESISNAWKISKPFMEEDKEKKKKEGAKV